MKGDISQLHYYDIENYDFNKAIKNYIRGKDKSSEEAKSLIDKLKKVLGNDLIYKLAEAIQNESSAEENIHSKLDKMFIRSILRNDFII